MLLLPSFPITWQLIRAPEELCRTSKRPKVSIVSYP